MIRHFVLFTPPDDMPSDQLERVLRAATELPRAIGEIRNFQLGETFDAVMAPRWAYCMSMEFADEKALDRYIRHPAHEEFRDVFRALIADRATHTTRPATV